MEGEGVGELVGNHDPRGWGAPRRNEGWPPARERRQCGRQIDEAVWVRLTHRDLQRVEQGVPLSGQVIECRQQEGPLTSAVLTPAEGGWAAEALPGCGGKLRDGGTEDGVQLWRRHEVTAATGPALGGCVVAEPWLKKGALHKPRKANRALALDLFANETLYLFHAVDPTRRYRRAHA